MYVCVCVFVSMYVCGDMRVLEWNNNTNTNHNHNIPIQPQQLPHFHIQTHAHGNVVK